MILNMCVLFYLFFIVINKNTYYLNKYIDERAGNDERVLIIDEHSISDKELLKNFHKKNLLDNLSNHNYSIDDKINMIQKWKFLEESLNNENDIKPFCLKNGGLFNDWEFEEF
jgi:hypothetical protein